MIIVSWNCRGLARDAAGRTLRALVSKHKPECILLSETKVDSVKMKLAMSLLGYPNYSAVDAIKKSGGICLAWQNGVDIEVTFENRNMINGLVFSDPPSVPWLLSAVYGPPYKVNRAGFWKKLQVVAEAFDGPWLCCGDFNSFTSQEEKEGGSPYSSSASGGLRSFMDLNGLVDLGCSGNPMTWNNRRPGNANIKIRLDRGVANLTWREMFFKASVANMVSTSSDHNPILINTVGEQGRKPYCFKFEAMWL